MGLFESGLGLRYTVFVCHDCLDVTRFDCWGSRFVRVRTIRTYTQPEVRVEKSPYDFVTVDPAAKLSFESSRRGP
jgi:hypothetical protein